MVKTHKMFSYTVHEDSIIDQSPLFGKGDNRQGCITPASFFTGCLVIPPNYKGYTID